MIGGQNKEIMPSLQTCKFGVARIPTYRSEFTFNQKLLKALQLIVHAVIYDLPIRIDWATL